MMLRQESDDPIVVSKSRPRNPGDGWEGKTWTTAILVWRRLWGSKGPRSGEAGNQPAKVEGTVHRTRDGRGSKPNGVHREA